MNAHLGHATSVLGANYQLWALLMMVCFLLVLVVGFFFVFLIKRHACRQRASVDPAGNHPQSGDLPSLSYSVVPLLLSGPSSWLAIQSQNVDAVQSALGLHNAVPCSWADGMARIDEARLFISPPIRGWILVFGHGLPDPGQDVDLCFHFLRRASRELGMVQFFSHHPAVAHHAWVKAAEGKIVRAYAWADETLWNEGALTPAERRLDLRCFDYGDGDVSGQLERLNQCRHNSERVFALAAQWSLDPTSIDNLAGLSGMGLAGDFSPISIR